MVLILKLKSIWGLGLNPSAGAATVASDQHPPLPSHYPILWKLLPSEKPPTGHKCSKPGPPQPRPGTFTGIEGTQSFPTEVMQWNTKQGLLVGTVPCWPEKNSQANEDDTKWQGQMDREPWFHLSQSWHTPSLPGFGYINEARAAHRLRFWPQLV